jgi:hypothetical protein
MTLNSSQRLKQLEDIVPETAPVAMIRQDVAAISKQNNLEFHESYDDLDFLVFATLYLHPASRVSLVAHRHSPTPGIEICVCHNQQNIAELISETLTKLDLTPNDLTWLHPNYEQQFSELVKDRPEQVMLRD